MICVILHVICVKIAFYPKTKIKKYNNFASCASFISNSYSVYV